MTDKMIRVAGVRFRENWKVYDFDAEGVDIAVGDRVVVDTERGPGLAVAVRLRNQAVVDMPPPPEPEVKMEQGLQIEEEIDIDAEPVAAPQREKGEQGPKPLRKVLRKATDDDLAKEAKNIEREGEAFKVAQDMVAERDLPMKLIRVEYSFDASRATFFFFSETRVDFRELVKDLAYKLKARIEMRQIGVRDVARMIGGFGPCGRELCCSAFLKNFEPVSIRMAKKQEMVLNPAKISGVCGRLLCCLSYEYQMYDEIKKDMAGMKEAVLKEKEQKEEERRATEEKRESEERKQAEEKRRQEDRRQQEQRRDKQKEEQKGKQEKKKEPQQEKKAQQPPPQQQQQQRQRQQQQPRQERQPSPEQKGQQPQQPTQQQQEGEKAAKKKKRRFWRRKKKGQQGEGTTPPKAE